MRQRILDPSALRCPVRNPQASTASNRTNVGIDFASRNQPLTPIFTANSLTRAIHLNEKESLANASKARLTAGLSHLENSGAVYLKGNIDSMTPIPQLQQHQQ